MNHEVCNELMRLQPGVLTTHGELPTKFLQNTGITLTGNHSLPGVVAFELSFAPD